MNVLGLDLSLSAPGIAYNEFPFVLPKTSLVGAPRLALRARQLMALVQKQPFDLAVIEGYSFGSHDAGSRSIGEMGGVTRLVLHESGIPFVEVAPSTLKKYATGKGNSKGKNEVIREAVKAGVTLPKKARKGEPADLQLSDDAADAWWLMQMALAHYVPSDPRVSLRPPQNRTTLASVKWPRVQQKEETS